MDGVYAENRRERFQVSIGKWRALIDSNRVVDCKVIAVFSQSLSAYSGCLHIQQVRLNLVNRLTVDSVIWSSLTCN